jgi:hypothetical protein
VTLSRNADVKNGQGNESILAFDNLELFKLIKTQISNKTHLKPSLISPALVYIDIVAF